MLPGAGGRKSTQLACSSHGVIVHASASLQAPSEVTVYPPPQTHESPSPTSGERPGCSPQDATRTIPEGANTQVYMRISAGYHCLLPSCSAYCTAHCYVQLHTGRLYHAINSSKKHRNTHELPQHKTRFRTASREAFVQLSATYSCNGDPSGIRWQVEGSQHTGHGCCHTVTSHMRLH